MADCDEGFGQIPPSPGLPPPDKGDYSGSPCYESLVGDLVAHWFDTVADIRENCDESPKGSGCYSLDCMLPKLHDNQAWWDDRIAEYHDCVNKGT